MVLLTTFAVWGGLVARIVFPRERPDLGLRLACRNNVCMQLIGVIARVSLPPSRLLQRAETSPPTGADETAPMSVPDAPEPRPRRVR